MFYLDFQGPRTKAVFKTGHEFFNLPQDSEEKTQSLREGMGRGYHVGKIARDEFELGKWVLPATFESQKERNTRTVKIFNEAVQTVLTLCAAVHIKIPKLSDDPAIPSDTALKLVLNPLIHEAGKVIHPWHIDVGLATLLWCDKVATQLLIYDEKGDQTEAWETVPVIKGSVLINVADKLTAKSGERLHSTVHPVVAPPVAKRVRNEMIYLLRLYEAAHVGDSTCELKLGNTEKY
ncbi:MAG: hypothetical protein Q9167_002229 [Letrouitia subvulpina]